MKTLTKSGQAGRFPLLEQLRAEGIAFHFEAEVEVVKVWGGLLKTDSALRRVLKKVQFKLVG